MSKVLSDTWNGLERFSDAWAANQAEILAEYLDDNKLDSEGLKDLLLAEAMRNRERAEHFLEKEMVSLFKIKYCSHACFEVHWRRQARKAGLEVYMLLNNGKNRDLLLKENEILADSLKYAVTEYRDIAEIYEGFSEGIDKLPFVSPWSINELKERDIDYLLLKLED